MKTYGDLTKRQIEEIIDSPSFPQRMERAEAKMTASCKQMSVDLERLLAVELSRS